MEEAYDLGEVLNRKENQELGGRLLATIQQDPVTEKLIAAANTVEDLYEAMKKYTKMTLADFKHFFKEVLEYLVGDKTALNDELLDNVVGVVFGTLVGKAYEGNAQHNLCKYGHGGSGDYWYRSGRGPIGARRTSCCYCRYGHYGCRLCNRHRWCMLV